MLELTEMVGKIFSTNYDIVREVYCSVNNLSIFQSLSVIGTRRNPKKVTYHI